jgi:hypothetical protein
MKDIVEQIKDFLSKNHHVNYSGITIKDARYSVENLQVQSKTTDVWFTVTDPNRLNFN